MERILFDKKLFFWHFGEMYQPPGEILQWLNINWQEIGVPLLAIANVDGIDEAVKEARNLFLLAIQSPLEKLPLKEQQTRNFPRSS